jgi:hypothetical protein
MTSASKTIDLVEDEVVTFKQHPGESLMKDWFRMNELGKRCPSRHVQLYVLRRFYNGINHGLEFYQFYDKW